MTSEWNQQLPIAKDDSPKETQGERAQIWIIGTRDQIVHLMNEFYVRKLATDRANFTPIIPAPFATGKYMTVLVR